MNAIKVEMALFGSTGKRGSSLETVYSYVLTVPQLSDNSVDTLCFLRSFYLRAKPKCN